MAQRAVLISRVQQIVGSGCPEDTQILSPEGSRAVMTFKAQSKHDRPPQEFFVRRTMRNMARFTAFDANARML